ncbi:MAG: dihydroorotate dehydrogenase-like protein [Saprospirales bacterium]|nr:dihydroorotate dehydrogenase-like protein [Saprospirales bacterium]MBK8923242.1 dihydroorotate dehydrogenase-like protein [Saprospirales bacterium]
MDLRTQYMGLDLQSPIVVSACPLSEEIGNIVQMEDAGAGAVVLFSLFEEQIRREQDRLSAIQMATTNVFAEGLDYFPASDEYAVGVEEYLELIRVAKERVDIPIIASLNGISSEGWIDYAQQMEQAGADGLEINVFYIAADIHQEGRLVEERYLEIVESVRSTVKIPVAVKLNPYFSAMGNMARELVLAGANGLVLFNRFYQPDFDINSLRVLNNLQYSVANEIRLPLLWISVLYGRLNASLAATTGVQSATEVIKYLLAGADVTMTASALYKHGIPHLRTMTSDLQSWMRDMQFKSVEAFKGALSQQNVSDPAAFERANYIRILEGAKR